MVELIATDLVKTQRDLIVLREGGYIITNAGSISNALNRQHISFIDGTDKEAVKLFEEFKGACLIIDPDLLEHINPDTQSEPNFSILVSDSPKLSFIKMLKEYFYDRKRKDIHPSAVIGEGVKIGAGTAIHANVVIYDGVQIGKNCKIKAGAVIGGNGFGYVQDKFGKWVHFPHIGTVILGDGVEIGSNSCVDRGTLDNTILHDGVKVDNLCQIGHNVEIGENTIVTSCIIIGGSTKIGSNCWLAPNSSIRDNITIGNNVLVGLGAVVVNNIPSDVKVKGTPAKAF